MEIAVLDQLTGPLSNVNWLEIGHLNLEKGKQVAACWLFEGTRVAAGICIEGLSMNLALPIGRDRACCAEAPTI